MSDFDDHLLGRLVGTGGEQAVAPPCAEHPPRTGGFIVLVGNAVGHPVDTNGKPDPYHRDACQLIFTLSPAGRVCDIPRDQLQLVIKLEKLVRAANEVFRADGKSRADTPGRDRFRYYFLCLHGAAHWGLEEGYVEGANAETDVVQEDLCRVGGQRIKNRHLRDLASNALLLSTICALVYAGLRQAFPWNPSLSAWLAGLGIDHIALANFMLVSIGCFIGVCLSYLLRTPTIGLDDIVTTDRDLLKPLTRLLFAATLTILLCLFADLKLADLSIGAFSLSQVLANGELAFVVGAICGISELALPASLGRKADLVARVK